jgi:DNA-binding transcriptional LysR family regulator
VNRFSLRALQYFVAAAQHKSISVAARQRNISPASISVTIAELEAELDIQLFVRQPAKGMRLTPLGEIVLAEARSLLAHADEFHSRTGSLGRSLQGELSVACFTNLAPVYFSNLLAQFCRLHPSVSINLYVGDHQEILSGLISGQYELALTFDLEMSGRFDWRPLAKIPPHIVLPAGHALARAKRLSLKRMASEPLILMDLPHTREYFLSLFYSLHLKPNVRFRSTNFETVRTLVGNELGYSILNLVPFSPVTYDGTRVRCVPISEKVRALEIGCLSSKRVKQRPIGAAFIDFTRVYFERASAGTSGSKRPLLPSVAMRRDGGGASEVKRARMFESRDAATSANRSGRAAK